MWNLAVSKDSERRIEDPKPRKLIAEKLPRPQLVSPQTATTPQPGALATAGAGGDARANGHTTDTPKPIETLITERE
jgi:hypothetical protein